MMRSFSGRLLMVISMLILCSCGSSESTSNLTVANNATESPQAPLIPEANVSRRILQCETYIETTWGNKEGQLGLCPVSSEQMDGPYPPVLNAHSDLFILDRVNQRILHYSKGELLQTIAIPSSYTFREPCSYSTRGLSNLNTYGDRLFLRFPSFHNERLVEYIAVLSPAGHEEAVISLEAYHPRYPPSAPVADTVGGFYLLSPTLSVLYFDADFRAEFMGIKADELLGSGGLVIGWDGNIYTYSASYDHLINWGTDNSRLRLGGEPISQMANVISTTQMTSSIWTVFLGADIQGRLYFGIREKSNVGYVVVRISAWGGRMVIATVPDGVLDTGASPAFSLAPDGSLYGMSYGLMTPDPTLNPRVIKCTFDE